MAFQSAVRIAVSLKFDAQGEHMRVLHVSIRRADRCLAEGTKFNVIRIEQRVSIRRADRCLAEGRAVVGPARRGVVFQSAVRIAVSLKSN